MAIYFKLSNVTLCTQICNTTSPYLVLNMTILSDFLGHANSIIIVIITILFKVYTHPRCTKSIFFLLYTKWPPAFHAHQQLVWKSCKFYLPPTLSTSSTTALKTLQVLSTTGKPQIFSFFTNH
jgi:hypothetical protein